MTTPRLDIAETIGPTLFVGGNDGSNGGKVTSSTTEALEGKQFIGLYFTVAKYCPSCVKFTPTLKASVANGLGDNAGGLQVITVSNDRTEDDFKEYCGAMPWVSIPYDRTQEVKGLLRDQYGIKTIPAMVILDAATGEVVTHTGRDSVIADPSGALFPWAGGSGATAISIPNGGGGKGGVKQEMVGGVGGSWRHMTFTERVFTKPLLAMGHKGINPSRPEEMYMDENAVRARAGIFNILSMLVLINITFLKWRYLMLFIYPIVCADFFFASIFGLTPLAPVGTLACSFVWLLHPEPHWKPAKPKRFAWIIGLLLVNTCLAGWLFESAHVQYFAACVCFLATWLEASAGFCVGCFMYNNMVVPLMGWDVCHECTM